MHFRRAILLFALVLGLTALATSIAPSQHGSSSEPAPPAPPPATAAGDGQGAATVEFRAPPAGAPPRRTVKGGQALTVEVASATLGQAAIPLLGQVAPVDPHTPASFALLPSPGSYEVVFTPSAGGSAIDAGALVVKP